MKSEDRKYWQLCVALAEEVGMGAQEVKVIELDGYLGFDTSTALQRIARAGGFASGERRKAGVFALAQGEHAPKTAEQFAMLYHAGYRLEKQFDSAKRRKKPSKRNQLF